MSDRRVNGYLHAAFRSHRQLPAGVIADQTSQGSFDSAGAINYSINAYIDVFSEITRGALACVVLVLLIWLYQSLKFRNRPLAVES